MSSVTSRPEAIARLVDLMTSFSAEWALCGGWAVDAWVGRQTREHLDIDIAIFEDEQRAVLEHFVGWQLLGHDDHVPGDTQDQWDDRRLEVPAHIHARGEGFDLDIQVNERSRGDWLFDRESHITLPLSRCVQPSSWGVSILAPEVILFYKAIPPAYRGRRPALRPHDDIDLEVLLSSLEDEQRGWLHDAIAQMQPGHPWLLRLVT